MSIDQWCSKHHNLVYNEILYLKLDQSYKSVFNQFLLVFFSSSSITDISKTGHNIGLSVVKFHTVNKDSFLSCKGGQNGITYSFQSQPPILNKIYNFATMDTPSDICTDDYGHIYVSGQGSNNIHRLVWESKKVKNYWEVQGIGWKRIIKY